MILAIGLLPAFALAYFGWGAAAATYAVVYLVGGMVLFGRERL